jgi:hypothetical protein
MYVHTFILECLINGHWPRVFQEIRNLNKFRNGSEIRVAPVTIGAELPGSRRHVFESF